MAGCVGGLGKGRSMRSGKGGWAGCVGGGGRASGRACTGRSHGSMRSMAGCVGGLGKGRSGGRGAWVVGVGQAGGHALGAGRVWMGWSRW